MHHGAEVGVVVVTVTLHLLISNVMAGVFVYVLPWGMVLDSVSRMHM